MRADPRPVTGRHRRESVAGGPTGETNALVVAFSEQPGSWPASNQGEQATGRVARPILPGWQSPR